jgi:hypothetical protein
MEVFEMSKIVWDVTGEKRFETGVKNGVLYVRNNSGVYPLGVPWNGLISVTESPTGAESTPLYADDIKYLNLTSVEEFEASIEAYTYPAEFEVCDGSAALATGVRVGQQARSTFGLAYKTTLGNDILNTEYGYKLHLIYGAMASPSEKAYSTISDSPEGIAFSWDLTTTPINVGVNGVKPTASIVIDSTQVDSVKLAALELILFGDVGVDARLPLPNEVYTLFAEAAPSPLALSTIVPADEATGVAVASDIVITFNNKIAKESIIVTSAAGSIVAGAKTWDPTGKILTFNPTVNLSGGTVYIVTIGGVIDVYSQVLAPVVKNFQTV